MEISKAKNKIGYLRRELVEVLRPVIYTSGFCKYGQADIVDSLLAAALQKESLEYVSHSPSSDTVFLRLKSVITPETLKSVVRALRPMIDTEVDVAVDGHDDMYHGLKVAGIVGTKEKLGSHTAFKYLVFKVIANGIEYVVDVAEMFDGGVTEPTIAALRDLLKTYRIRRIVADGEFYSVGLIRFLQSVGIEWVIKGRSFAALEALDFSYNVPYKNSDILLDMGKEADGDTPDYFVYRFKGRKNKEGECRDFYVASSLRTSGKTIRSIVKSRWGIETGFREINRVKVKTCTRNHLLRMLLYSIACYVYNAWVSMRRISRKVRMRLNVLKRIFIEVIRDRASRILRLVGISASIP